MSPYAQLHRSCTAGPSNRAASWLVPRLTAVLVPPHRDDVLGRRDTRNSRVVSRAPAYVSQCSPHAEPVPSMTCTIQQCAAAMRQACRCHRPAMPSPPACAAASCPLQPSAPTPPSCAHGEGHTLGRPKPPTKSTSVVTGLPATINNHRLCGGRRHRGTVKRPGQRLEPRGRRAQHQRLPPV